MEKRDFKDQVYSTLAALVKAMANPHRLEIIDLLGQSERSVEDIATETGVSVANASQHLQLLKQSNLVQIRRNGNFIVYRLASDKVSKVWNELREIGMESLPQVDKIVNEFRSIKGPVETVHLQDLPAKQASNSVLLDVRPEPEFSAGHIPNSINIPIDQLPRRISELKKSTQYVVYCRGLFCVFADDAVHLLAKKGYNAIRLAEGYPEWEIKHLRKGRVRR